MPDGYEVVSATQILEILGEFILESVPEHMPSGEDGCLWAERQRRHHNSSLTTVSCPCQLRHLGRASRWSLSVHLFTGLRGGQETHLRLGYAKHQQSQCQHPEKELPWSIGLLKEVHPEERKGCGHQAGHLRQGQKEAARQNLPQSHLRRLLGDSGLQRSLRVPSHPFLETCPFIGDPLSGQGIPRPPQARLKVIRHVSQEERKSQTHAQPANW